MPVTLLATAVPVPIRGSGLSTLASAYEATSPALLTARAIESGDTFICAPINENAKRAEILGRYGAGMYGVGYGLAVSAGTGLAVNVSAGQAIADGVVELEADSLVVPASQANVFIWLKRDGTLTYELTTTPPADPAVYLGRAVTDGSAVTSVDESGVVKLIGGMAVRDTADVGEPGDSPSSGTAFLTRTLAGTYLWDGASYVRLAGPVLGVKNTLVSGDSAYLPAGHQQVIFGALIIPSGATFVSAGDLQVRS